MPGPYYRDSGAAGSTSPANKRTLWRKQSMWYTTPKGSPRKPLPYTMLETELRITFDGRNEYPGSISIESWGNISDYPAWYPISHLQRNAQIEAIKKLSAGLRTASWGQNLAEWKSSLGLVASTLQAIRSPLATVAKTMDRYSKAYQRGLSFQQWIKANGGRWKSVNSRGWPQGIAGLTREFTNDLNNALFAWDFGVAPLLDDIRESLKPLTIPTAEVSLKRTAKVTGTGVSRLAGNPVIVRNRQGKYGCTIGCTVVVDNPALFRAQTLGLLNVPQILLEVVPLSFVVNWVYPIIDWTSTFTAFAGIATSKWYETSFHKVIENHDKNWSDGSYVVKGVTKTTHVVRKTTPTQPIPPIPKAVDWSKLNVDKYAVMIRLAGQRLINL